MIIDSKKFGGVCACGREHRMETKEAVIEPGCLHGFDAHLERHGITGKRSAIYGSNTYFAKGLVRPRAEQEIVLNSENLHADEHATAEVLGKLKPGTDVLIAVGSGTIHDITRYCAHKLGIPFVSVPTAASVDGFCSTVSAMTLGGYKTTLPGVAPELVIADVDVIKNAPLYLARSGVGDILAKYVALADWKIAHALTGEHFCPVIYSIMLEATNKVRDNSEAISAGDTQAYVNVIYGLVMSGIAMQMMGNSRPASGAEHHISHFIETQPQALDCRSEALHGEKVGVGAVLASEEYHRLAAGAEDLTPYVRPYQPLGPALLTEIFGERLAGATLEENANDCARSVTPERLAECWPEIRAIVSEIPPADTLSAILAGIGAKHTLADIGVEQDKKKLLLDYSPFIRNRLTLMRLRRMIDL